MKPFDVIVVGEIFADHVFAGFEDWPRSGQEIHTEHYTRELGGGAANTACALARMGRNTAIAGAVHKNDGWIENRLKEFGVIPDPLQHVPLPTGVTVSISTQTDRTFFTYPGANQLLPSYLETQGAESQLASACHVHFAMPLGAKPGESLLALLKNAGCTLSLDPGYQEKWLQSAECRQICRYLDYFFPNEEEGRLMTGQKKPSDILAALEDDGISGTVLKLGPAGATTLAGAGLLCAKSPSVKVLDTTGAGDAFDAGFIDALLDTAPLSCALERACICGALSTRGMGALSSLPDREELKAFYEECKK